MTTPGLLLAPGRRHEAAPADAHRLLPDAVAGGGPGLADHLRRHGELPAPDRSPAWRRTIAAEAERAGLLGHGGAAFPTMAKVRAVASQPRRAVVIANGTEGEPASMKDRTLLARAPHLVLDGASVAAGLVRAREIVVVVHHEVRGAVDVAAEERRRAGLDGTPLRIVTAADRFVAGEASAVVNWVGHGKALPLGRSPRMSERGLGGRPTLVQNVETLAHLALIARHGAAWYRTLGTPEEPGTMLVTLLGALERPGVHEVEIGAPVAEVLARAGGPTARLQSLLVGGYFGSWLPAGPVLARPFSARGLGVGLGAGVVVAFPADACGVTEAARLARYLASESAGQCGPCRFGLPAIAEEMTRLAEGRSTGTGDLRRWLVELEGRGACSHPDGTVRQLAGALEVFAADVAAHLDGARTAPAARRVLPIPRGSLR